MAPTTTWLAATTGSPPLAQQVNALLSTHPFQNLFTGNLQSSVTTTGTPPAQTNGTWLAQSFTTAVGQTTIGYVQIQLYGIGPSTPQGPTTVSIYTNVAGAPGVPLISTQVTAEYTNVVTTLDVTFPLPITGLTASTQYWIVVAAEGTSSVYYSWNKSASTSGASTSPNGTTWTAQTYGLKYKVYDQAMIQPIAAIWEDNGARWTAFYYNTNGSLLQLGEYTAGQTTAGYTQSVREVNYSNGLPFQVV